MSIYEYWKNDKRCQYLHAIRCNRGRLERFKKEQTLKSVEKLIQAAAAPFIKSEKAVEQ